MIVIHLNLPPPLNPLPTEVISKLKEGRSVSEMFGSLRLGALASLLLAKNSLVILDFVSCRCQAPSPITNRIFHSSYARSRQPRPFDKGRGKSAFRALTENTSQSQRQLLSFSLTPCRSEPSSIRYGLTGRLRWLMVS